MVVSILSAFFSSFRYFDKVTVVCCLAAKLCPTLFEILWTVTRQARLSLGFPRQEDWSGLSFPPPGHLPDLGFEPRSPALEFFTTEPPWCVRIPSKEPKDIVWDVERQWRWPSRRGRECGSFLLLESSQSELPCSYRQGPTSRWGLTLVLFELLLETCSQPGSVQKVPSQSVSRIPVGDFPLPYVPLKLCCPRLASGFPVSASLKCRMCSFWMPPN